MPAPSVIFALKKLRHERGSRSPFRDHTDFLRWADEAEPLLAFNQTLADEFRQSVHAAKMVLGWKQDKYDGAVNSAIGAVNRAITELEHQEPAAPQMERSSHVTPLTAAPPDKLTMKWLYEHAPWSFYVWLLGALGVAFGLGFTASETLTAMKNPNLSSAAPTTTKPTNANVPSKSASQP